MQRLTDATNRAEREKKEEMVGRKKEEEEYIGLQSRRKGQRREEPLADLGEDVEQKGEVRKLF